jgi:hypothetical protein
LDKKGEDIMKSENIALNFLPLSEQNFLVTVYRRVYQQGDRKVDFFDCSRRRLPSEDNINIFLDYWVSLSPKNGFVLHEFYSSSNPYLALEIIFL